jgi:type II secretory pathway predicted ATPase ExeA
MYLSHYNLNEKPFLISTDPRFLWLGENHREALATLKYGILYNDGYVLITGNVGTGKTTLANALIHSLGNQIITAKVADPGVEIPDFFKIIANAYGINEDFNSKGSFLSHFNTFLQQSFAEGKKVVIIIDEAQVMNRELLEEVRHLSNIEENGTRILNLVFVGQNEFNDILLEDANRALRQRITISYDIAPLTEDETRDYIWHRLEVAGSKSNIFSADAIHEIFLFSNGIPRLINVICDLALLSGYLDNSDTIEAQIIKECAEQLRLPGEKAESAQQKPESLPEVRRKPLGTKMVSVALLALMLIVLGYVYFLYENRESQHSTTLKAFSEQVKKESNRGLGNNNASKDDGVAVTPVSKMPFAAEEPGHLQSQSKDLNSQIEHKDTKTVKEIVNPNLTNLVGTESETMNDNKAGSSPAALKEVFIEFLRKENRSQEEEKGLDKRGYNFLAGQDENTIEDKEEGNQDSGRKTSEREGESPDPTEVIDWLLKEHSASK